MTNSPTDPSLPEPFLTLHTAFVLVTAALIGCAVGVLTHLGGTHTALAVLAGLTAAGGAVPVLRGLIR
ncbi:hypothetical protein OHS33_04210 [Streptomyces sp. NBC_00536]|uniref:hypothetical protein n=1 Tax=Streptomyces sp. NBC_00536 TaxID=2975769 RepID=UPI002E810825|nr:hypothetical protein [Streptomyces sp. NBC_00536]WUC77609.1 hypothetical protein OHS33_04210 [Streptomyces sp. NBC_00536]